MIHAAFSLASSVLFFVVAFLLVVADHELEPMSRSLLAAPHSMCELRMLLCKTAITVADILLRPLPHYQASVYAAACALMLWYQIRWVSGLLQAFDRSTCCSSFECCKCAGLCWPCSHHNGSQPPPTQTHALSLPLPQPHPPSPLPACAQAPHLSAWINCFRAGLNAVLCWVSVCLFAVTFSVEWHDNDEAGSHAHYTWSPRPPRVLWTTVSGVAVRRGCWIGDAGVARP